MFQNKLVHSLLLAIMVVALAFQAEAQTFRSSHTEYFDLDTLTNAGTVTFLPSKMANNVETYTYQWQVITTNISGTTAGSIIIEESLWPSGDYWAPVDTVAISAAGSLLFSGNLTGIRQRIRVVGTGTQSTQTRVGVIYRKLEQ